MKKTLLKTAALSSLIASSMAFAATDGSLGATSNGNVIVQISKGTVVQITDLDDLLFGNFTAIGALGVQATDMACVYSSVGTYHATLTSANGGAGTGVFRMVNGASAPLPYTVTFNGQTAGSTALPATGAFTGNATDPTCNGYTNNNATITATVAQSDFTTAADGNYSDVLTILIAPN